MKNFTTQEIIILLNQVMLGEISFLRMVEVMNEMVSEAEDIPAELKNGDLAIFWDNNKKYAIIRLYKKLNESEVSFRNKDQSGFDWKNAIKLESKEQYEKLIRGEI